MGEGRRRCGGDRTQADVHPDADRRSVIAAMLWLSAALAVAAIALALWAEVRRESSLFLGAGFICGASGLLLVSRVAGFAALGLGALAILAVRARCTLARTKRRFPR